MPTKKEKREAEEKKNTREGCFGTHSDDDENCDDDCPDYDDCVERTKEIEEGLSEDTDEDDLDEDTPDDEGEEPEEEGESDSKVFVPASLDLSDPTTRIDIMADMEVDNLLSLAKYHKVKIPEDAKGDESEIMILIDDYLDHLPDDEPEEEEKPKSGKKKESEQETAQDEEQEDDLKEEEEKPKPRRRRKKKADPEPELEGEVEEPDSEDVPEDTKKVEPKIASKDSAIVASDIVMEVVEIILDRSESHLVAHGDLDHMVGVRDKLNSIIAANKALGTQVDSPDAEPEKEVDPEPELEPDDLGPEEDGEPEEEDEPEYPDHPDYFAEIAKANGAKVYVKGDTVSMKIGPTVLAMLVLHKEEWQVLFNKGKLDKLPGTKAYKAPRKYPAIPADHARAGKLLDFHVKTRKRGMRKSK